MSELRHYGVLGMKWGVRRYQNKDGTLTALGKKHGPYKYKSWGTKHNERKAEKAKSKGNMEKAAEFERRAKRSAELDRRELQYAKRVRGAANVLLGSKNPVYRTLAGGYGTKSYQQWMAMLGGTNRAGGLFNITARKLGAQLASTMLGGRIGSTAAKAIYIRGTYENLFGLGKSIQEERDKERNYREK